MQPQPPPSRITHSSRASAITLPLLFPTLCCFSFHTHPDPTHPKLPVTCYRPSMAVSNKSLQNEFYLPYSFTFLPRIHWITVQVDELHVMLLKRRSTVVTFGEPQHDAQDPLV
ncbi:hypothetical protein FQA47_002579 [Oryzias melastigma]|uniref:Uncharacterized protein n=1 Tax=Oryzias melastigma TaxID=30732 RepID=A0A834EWQ8_ORYME|nr:hypothetical protein FQA47_002579 [Oryzias melastigma]